MAALEWSSSAVYALQRPGVPIGPPELTFDHRDAGRLCGSRGEEVFQARDAEFARRLELGQQCAELRDFRMREVMICTDKYRDLAARGSGDQLGAHQGPSRSETFCVCDQRGSDLVSITRQMVEQHLASVGTTPTVEVALLSRFPT